jgi:hypothetical protein
MMKRVLGGSLLALMLAGSLGCSYAGIVVAQDQTIYVGKNGLAGLLRKMYSCKSSGTALTCSELGGAP